MIVKISYQPCADDTTKLHPCILKSIWLGLVAVRTKTPYPDIHREVPIPLLEPIKQQLSLGWQQLYSRCLSSSWAIAIDTLHPTLAIIGKQVMINITKATWKYILDTWQLHNTHLHQNADQLNHPNYQ